MRVVGGVQGAGRREPGLGALSDSPTAEGGSNVAPPADAAATVETVSLSVVNEEEVNQQIAQQLSDISDDDLEKMLTGNEQKEKLATRPDDILKGQIIAISGEYAFVDLGGKDQGVIGLEEFPKDAPPTVGDQVQAVMVEYDARDGLILMSISQARKRILWQELAVGKEVECNVTGFNKGGLEVLFEGISGFIPASQADLQRLPDLSGLVGQTFTCEVIDVNRAEENVILSRRAVLAREQKEKRQQILAQLSPGQVRQGTVSRLADFGAFVDIGGIDGLIHISDMSWSRVKQVSDVLQEGQIVDVMIIKVDPDKQRISLGLKQVGPNPWDGIEHRYPPQTKIKGRVVRLESYGAFVELEAGVVGLIPIGQMSWTKRIGHPSDVLKENDVVEAMVSEIDEKKRRVSLSLRQVAPDPWSETAEKYPQNALVTGTVTQLTDFGAFVKLDAGIDGLVHISEMGDKKVEKVSDAVEVGQEVQVRVLNVDPKQRRISLSMKIVGFEPAAGQSGPGKRGRGKSVDKSSRRRGGLDHGAFPM